MSVPTVRCDVCGQQVKVLSPNGSLPFLATHRFWFGNRRCRGSLCAVKPEAVDTEMQDQVRTLRINEGRMT